MTVDITELVKLVRAADVAATLKAFVAVLAPFLVVANLQEILGFIQQAAAFEFDLSEYPGAIAASLAIAVLFAFAPLMFIVMDWLASEEEVFCNINKHATYLYSSIRH